MVKRVHKTNGYYHINNHKYDILIGSRAQVWHGTAYKTPGGLTKRNLLMNKHGRVVSKKKHASAKKEKRLEKAGYKPQKGKFMLMRKSMKKSRSAKRKNKSKRLVGGLRKCKTNCKDIYEHWGDPKTDEGLSYSYDDEGDCDRGIKKCPDNDKLQ